MSKQIAHEKARQTQMMLLLLLLLSVLNAETALKTA